MKLSIFTIIIPICLIISCTEAVKPTKNIQSLNAESHNPHNTKVLTNTPKNNHVAIDDFETRPIITADDKIQINWALIDTNTQRADTINYKYPIALDSQAVKNYAKAYHISDHQAQHSIVVSMATPEVLGKLLDQLEDGYKEHELTDGADMTLIIHTKNNVVADKHEYVFADKFGEGLVLPIEIRPAK